MNNNKGFGIIETIILLCIITITGVAAYLYWNSQITDRDDVVSVSTPTPTEISISATDEPSPSPTPQQEQNYVSDDFGITFQIPNGFKIERSMGSIGCDQLEGIDRQIRTCTQDEVEIPQLKIFTEETDQDGSSYDLIIEPAQNSSGASCGYGATAYRNITFLGRNRNIFTCEEPGKGAKIGFGINHTDDLLTLPESSRYKGIFVYIFAKDEEMYQQFLNILSSAK
ncbi:hypothetical protein HGA91_05875 [candidate division WWE3 bacterium]|nr:hypothetical protein [candidate division WWE3 bacterium]